MFSFWKIGQQTRIKQAVDHVLWLGVTRGEIHIQTASHFFGSSESRACKAWVQRVNYGWHYSWGDCHAQSTRRHDAGGAARCRGSHPADDAGDVKSQRTTPDRPGEIVHPPVPLGRTA